MGLLDLFRPRWKHSNPTIRAEAIKDFSSEDLSKLSQVARHDSDPRVRRIALKKIVDLDLLAELAASDPDEGLRRDAGEKLGELQLSLALAGEDEEKSLAIVAKLTSQRAFAEIAARGQNETVALAALARLTEERRLTEVAQKTRSKAVRTAARDRLGDVEKKPKVKAKAETRAKAQPAAPPVDPAQKRREEVCQRLEVAAKSSDPEDYSDTDDLIAQSRAEWQAAPGEASAALKKRFERAVARLQERRAVLTRKTAQAQAQPILPIAKAVPVEPPPPPRMEPVPAPAPPPKPVVVEKTPEELEELKRLELARQRREEERRQREAEQAERMRLENEKRAAEEKLRAEQQEKNLARVEEHCDKLEKLAQAESLKPKQAEQALKQAQEVMMQANPLPREKAAVARKRYDAARAALVIKLQVLRENEDWQRWANIPRLEALVEKIEAVAEALDDGAPKSDVAAALKILQAEWKTVGPAPKDKSEALWNRFKEKGDQIFDKLRASSDEERAQNLQKKEALCEKVDALFASLSTVPDAAGWKTVADSLKALQADWKAAGPVPTKEQADALWQRFKTTADKVYAEQKAHYAELDEERGENLKKKEALCKKVEAVALSIDWKGTSELLKSCQADWKAIGAGPRQRRDEEEALWARFRGACDKFFERRQAAFAKQDEERGENLKKKEALCDQAEALLRKEDLDQDDGESEIKRLQAEWKRIGPVPKEQADVVWGRFRGAADQVFGRGRQYESAPAATEDSGQPQAKFANKINLDGVLRKLQGAAEAEKPVAETASATSPAEQWEHDAASEWEDIDRVISGQTPDPESPPKTGR
jgi:hypothetical protein